MTLQEFIRLPHRFMWGGSGRPHPSDGEGRIYNDCTTFCATWVEVLTGIDPAADHRGSYHDADGAHAILTAAGGIVAFMGSKLEPIGFKRVQKPETGDIGVIHAIAGLGYSADIGAISYGPLWATLGPTGVAAKKVEFISAWRLAV